MSDPKHPPHKGWATRVRHWQQRLNVRFGLDRRPTIRKVVYSVIGITILLIGIVMLVLPGPAILVIPIGLLILATEFAWARRVIRRGRVFVGRRWNPKVPRQRK